MENENKKKSIFRQQSIDRVSTPEELDGYLKVTSPGVWFTLIAIVVILIGVISWMIFGHLDTKLTVAVASQNGETVCIIPKSAITESTNLKKIKIADKEYSLTDIGYAEQTVTKDTNEAIISAASLKVGDKFLMYQVEAKLTDGIFNGEITVETVSPMSFITN